MRSDKMSLKRPQHILHRMIPLICQALITSPGDTSVWVEGLAMLCNPKLHRSMTAMSSIWLPLLLTSLEAGQEDELILSGLGLLRNMGHTLEPMKSCLIKPLAALARREGNSDALRAEIQIVVVRMGLPVSVTLGQVDMSLVRTTSPRPRQCLTSRIWRSCAWAIHQRLQLLSHQRSMNHVNNLSCPKCSIETYRPYDVPFGMHGIKLF